jgi:eukaryotic-like serine/threonine-protein kinase
MNASADRNLLFGVVAVQMDFISRDALVVAMNAWALDKARSLGQILVAQNALSSQRHDLLEALVDEHLKQHGNDPQQSLATLPMAADIRDGLTRISDGDLQVSLARMETQDDTRQFHPDDMPGRTIPLSTTTSSGNRFRIVRPWREGGLGKVSVALDEELNREVALKEIKYKHAKNQTSRERFLLEAEVTGALEHPGVVPVYGLGHYGDGRPFYAMRFVRGDSLDEAIQRFHKGEGAKHDSGQRSVAFRELLGRFIDVCNAIAYAHSRGVLHRDLKPGNILLGEYGETLVVDWGLAKVADKPDELEPASLESLPKVQSRVAAATQMGMLIGTPAFMSPEQAHGRLDLLGPASDVYSLGATLYCVLTGANPFSDTSVETVLERVRRGEFQMPREVNPSIPRPLEAICLKAMAMNVGDRYATPTALGGDLEHWLADEPVSAYREGIRERAGRWVRRHRAAALATAVALAVTSVTSIAALVLINRQREIAETARGEAEASFREARNAVDQFFTKVSEDTLLNQPGMQRLRNDLLEKTLEYDKRFLAQRAHDPSVKEELAATLFRMGRIEELLKAPDQAVPYFEQARDIQRTLVDEAPRDAKRIEALAATENALGREFQLSRKYDEALAAYQKGRGLREQLTELDPQNKEYWRLCANSMMNIGLLDKDEGRLDAAAQQLQAAQAMRQEHLAGSENVPKLRRDLAMGFYNQGVLDSQRRQNDAAAEHFGDAIAQFKELHNVDPNDLEIQLDLAINERLLADLKRTDPQQAAKLYDDACKRLDLLVERNPDVPNFRYERARAYMNFGQMPQEDMTAADRLRIAKSALASLAQESPLVPAYRLDLALVQRALGGVEARMEQNDAARTDLEESISLLEQLVKDFPEDQQYALELASSRRAWKVVFEPDGLN